MFAIGIVAHHSRRAMANELAEQVDATVMSVDNGTIGAGSNHRRVWANLEIEDTDWSVVLEEDALPINDFRHQLDQVLRAAPTPIVSLYLGRLRPPQYQSNISDALAKAKAAGAHWITASHCLHAVALAVRTELVADLVGCTKTYLPIDQAIGRWARQRGHEIGYCIPSIVEHRDGPSLIQHLDGSPRLPGRVAWQLGPRTSWNSDSVTLF